MHDPRAPHMEVLKRVLLYLKGTIDCGIHLLHSADLHIITCSYTDWGDTRRSTSGYCVYLGSNLVSWSSER